MHPDDPVLQVMDRFTAALNSHDRVRNGQLAESLAYVKG
jgi:hypothetical protein